MKIILLISLIVTNPWILDFGNKNQEIDWNIVNDGVMGGKSESEAFLLENSLLFKGTLSLENNGGFASIRSPYEDYNFSDAEFIEIKYRSEGGDFNFRLEQSRYFFNPYLAMTLPQSSKWTVQKIKTSELKVLKMGKELGVVKQDQEINARRLSIMKSDKQPGPFQIEIDYIKIY
ncbi:MAG: CIA30 family protein [Flavobacteriaceae bacterium]